MKTVDYIIVHKDPAKQAAFLRPSLWAMHLFLWPTHDRLVKKGAFNKVPLLLGANERLGCNNLGCHCEPLLRPRILTISVPELQDTANVG